MWPDKQKHANKRIKNTPCSCGLSTEVIWLLTGQFLCSKTTLFVNLLTYFFVFSEIKKAHYYPPKNLSFQLHFQPFSRFILQLLCCVLAAIWIQQLNHRTIESGLNSPNCTPAIISVTSHTLKDTFLNYILSNLCPLTSQECILPILSCLASPSLQAGVIQTSVSILTGSFLIVSMKN